MLFLFYEGAQPVGIFDFDKGSGSNTTILSTNIQGGMIGKFGSATDTSMGTIPLGDGFDEYGASLGVNPNTKTVIMPCETNNIPGTGPYLILDDGSTGYGTTYGHQFGNATGAVANDNKSFHAWYGGTQVGPNTLMGSGKVTGWITPGLYGTDYYDTTAITAAKIAGGAGALVPGSVLAINVTLSCLTNSGTAFGAGQVCYFVSFLGDPSYVSTSFPTIPASYDTAWPIMLFMWK